MFGKTNIVVPKKSYVTDGLVLHLDGIDYGGQSGKWINLVDGTEFTVSNNIEKLSNCFHFTSSDGQNKGIKSPVRYSIVTTEVVLKTTSALINKAVLCVDKYDKVIGFNSGGYLQYGGSGTSSNVKSIEFPLNKICSVSGNYSSNGIYLNGVLSSIYQTIYNQYYNYLGDANIQTNIGSCTYSNWGFTGDIYAVRIYNRSLTADETAQNFAVDKARFSIT